jgi:hypothetical protein
MDSLPFRFGFNFDTNTLVDIKVFECLKSKKKADRWEVDGQLVSPLSGRVFDGTFIIGKRPLDDTPVLLTAWRHDADEEFYLSNLIRRLREKELITAEWLKDHFEHYDSGELRTADQLVKVFIKEAEANSRSEYREALEEAVGEAKQLTIENADLLDANGKLLKELTDTKSDLNRSIVKNLEKDETINQQNAELNAKDKALQEKDLQIQRLMRGAYMQKTAGTIVSRAPTPEFIDKVIITTDINRYGKAVKVINLYMSDGTIRKNNWANGFEERLELAERLKDDRTPVYTDVWNTPSSNFKYDRWFKNIYLCD